MVLSCKVLKNGVEVKLQRNALSVLEHPTGNEEEGDDHDFDNSSTSSEIGDKDNDFCELHYIYTHKHIGIYGTVKPILLHQFCTRIYSIR